MPLAASIGMGAKELINLSGDFQKVNPKNVVLIATRDLDEEKKLISEK